MSYEDDSGNMYVKKDSCTDVKLDYVKDNVKQQQVMNGPGDFHHFDYKNIVPHQQGIPTRNQHIIRLFGCDTCPWKCTDSCDHGIGVLTDVKGNLLQRHSNHICGKRISFVRAVCGPDKTHEQMLQLIDAVDNRDYSRHLLNRAKQSEGMGDNDKLFHDRLQVAQPWVKMSMDALKDIRKQDEGSKVQVVKNELDDLRSVVDVTPNHIDHDKD